MRRLGALFLTLPLTMVACAPAPPPTPPRVYDVQVDGRADPFFLAASQYFPKELEAHPGDTIRFTAVDRGEIHTVTLGTLVDAALATLAKVHEGATQPSLESLKLPALFVGTRPAELGRSAVQPCFIDRGVPPAQEACTKEQQRQPEFSGTQSLFNSGYLPGGAVFAVRLSDSIQPGTYGFLCLLHGPEMAGRIVVAAKDRAVPSPFEVKARGSGELERVVRDLQRLVEAAPRSLPRATVWAGIAASEKSRTQATLFAPAEVTVRAGETLTWWVNYAHTISFNAPQDAVGTVIKASDGSWTLNARAFNQEKAPARSSGVPGGPLTLDSGAWDGKGFRSSGIICPPQSLAWGDCEASDVPMLVTYKVTFTEPGTYVYRCLLHPDMEGTVEVGN